MGLYINTLKDDYSKYLVQIMFPSSAPVQCVLEGIYVPGNEFDITTTAEVGDSKMASGFLAAGNINNAVAESGKALAEQAGMGDSVGGAIDEYAKSIKDSVIGWTGVKSPFTFSIGFVVFKTGTDGVGTCSSYKTLLKNVNMMTNTKSKFEEDDYNPAWSSSGRIEWWTAALAAASNESAFINNTFTVNIGDWFSCNRLIPTAASVKFSKYLNEDGAPQYAIVSASFTTYRVLNNDEISEIIKV